MKLHGIARLAAMWIAALCLAACGGGGGGGAGAGSGSGSGSGGAAGSGGSSGSGASSPLTFTQSSISVVAQQGASARLEISAKVNNPQAFAGISPLYVEIVDTQQVFTLGQTGVYYDNGLAAVNLTTLSSLAVGDYHGTLQINVCADSTCSSTVAGSPWSMPYLVKVRAHVLGISLPQSGAINFGEPGLTQTMPLEIAGTGLQWSVQTDVPWLQPAVASGSGTTEVALSILGKDLKIGSYSGAVTVSTSDGQSITQNVSLSVMANSPLTVAPLMRISPVVVTNAGSNPTGQHISIGAQYGLNWSASTTASWISLPSASGTVPGGIEVEYNSANLAPGNYSATVQVQTSDGQSTSVPIALTVYDANASIAETYAGGLERIYMSQSLKDGSLAQAVLGQVSSMIADASGNIYFADGEIRKIGSDGMVASLASTNMPAGGPMSVNSMARDSKGNLYVSATPGYGTFIYTLAPGGSALTFYLDGLQLGFTAAGLAIDGQDNLYISDAQNSRILKVGPGGTLSTFATFPKLSNVPAANATPSPAGLAFDGSGNLFVADVGTCLIYKITPAGAVSNYAGSPGTCLNPQSATTGNMIMSPIAMALRANGDLFVVDAVNHIRKIDTDGHVTLVSVQGGPNNGGTGNGPLDGAGLGSMIFVGNTLYAGSTAYDSILKITNLP